MRIAAMKLSIVEIVRRNETFKFIAAFERDSIGERNSRAKIYYIVRAALCAVMEPIIAKPVLQQDPGRAAA